uniref:Variant surface glycoprotein n=1 Tax=Trypanosoma brucei TaxID=5691 RepID=S5FUT1_9TRYP|nr:variant surface glycoprotein [Trypanosoma brucei]
MGKIVGIVLGLLLIVDTFRSADAAGKFGVKKTSWKPLCEATTDLRNIPSDVAANLKAGATQVKKMILDSTRATIYSQLQKGSKEADRAITISAYMLGAALRAVSHLESNDIINGVDLAAKSGYLKGHIDEFLNVAEKVSQSTEHCLLDTAGTAAATFAAKALAGEACDTTLADTTATRSTAKKLTAKGHKGATDPANDGDQHHAASTYSCRLFSKGNTDGLGKTGSVRNGITWAAGYYRVPTTADEPLQILNLQESAAATRDQSSEWQKLFAAIAKKPDDGHSNYANNSKTMDSDPEATELLSKVLLNEKGKSSTDIKKMREDIFTAELASVVDRTFANIHNEKLPAKVAGIEKGKSLGEITDPTELAALLAALLLETDTEVATLKKKLEATNERPGTVTETTCNTIKGEAECNRTAACSFNNTETDDNKKCKFNATKALKSGVPVTQAQAATGTENGKTASDRCTKHKDKENCEKENEGQKPGEKAKCGWIEDKCKDSSFLATKKFALSVVSAAFVALLF